MTFALPDSRFGMTRTNYNLGALPKDLPEYDIIAAANRLNAHRFGSLTYKQRVFVDTYLAHDFDATAAALAAGFAQDEAERVGRKMLKRPEILQAIEFALQYFSETQKLRFERVVDEIKIIALTSITELVDPSTAEPLLDRDPDDPRWRAVKKIKRTPGKYGTTVEIELHSKLDAIGKLLRILEPRLAADPDALQQNTTNNVNVTNVNIIPVPSGQFLPAPISPYALPNEQGITIEHSSSAEQVIQPAP